MFFITINDNITYRPIPSIRVYVRVASLETLRLLREGALVFNSVGRLATQCWQVRVRVRVRVGVRVRVKDRFRFWCTSAAVSRSK